MQTAYKNLFQNNKLLTNIGYMVFKEYKEKALPLMHCAFVLAICDILLSPLSPEIKCKDRSVARHIYTFMVSNTLNLLKVCIKNHSYNGYLASCGKQPASNTRNDGRDSRKRNRRGEASGKEKTPKVTG